MKNLKPSQLPEDTVIGKKAWGHYDQLYIKKADGIWEDLFSGCGCCEPHEKISDKGCLKDENYALDSPTTTMTSDEYFTDFKIIAVPPGVVFDVEALHGPFIDVTQTYLDATNPHDCKGYNCEEP